MKKSIYMLLICLLYGTHIMSQLVPEQLLNNVELTPNAHAFSVYGKIPIDMYRGVPTVQIPLKEVHTNSIQLNISLNYHADGFKANTHSSWVGHNWSLLLGGVINRSINGLPDENNSGVFTSYSIKGGKGYFYSTKMKNELEWTESGISILERGNQKTIVVNPELSKSIDLDRQPDSFHFSFMGYSGVFYLSHTGEWKVQSESPIRVVFDNQDLQIVTSDSYLHSTPTFKKFTLIDSKGIKYVFGGDNAIEYSVGMNCVNHDYAHESTANSWYLKEIIPPVGESIIFTYERGPFMSSISSAMRYNDAAVVRSPYSNDPPKIKLSGTVISPVYLRSIDILEKNLKVEFETSISRDMSYDELWYRDMYESTGYSGSFLGQQIDPIYNIPYFIRNKEEAEKVKESSRLFSSKFIRLKLDKILFRYSADTPLESMEVVNLKYNENVDIRRKLIAVEKEIPSQAGEVYRFRYFNNNLGVSDVVKEPKFFDDVGDHWGYINGRRYTEILKGYTTLSEREKLFIHDPMEYPMNSTTTKLGVLDQIVYPTGGYSEFFYENHTCSYVINKDNSGTPHLFTIYPEKEVSGLRIKRIVDVDEQGAFYSRDYDYKQAGYTFSSGVLENIPGLYRTPYELLAEAGGHMHYGHVKEIYKDGSFKATSFTSEIGGLLRPNKTSAPAILDDGPVYLQIPTLGVKTSSRAFERGKVSDEFYCDSLGYVTRSVHYDYVNVNRNESNFIRSSRTRINESTEVLPTHINQERLTPYELPRSFVSEHSWLMGTSDFYVPIFEAFYFYTYQNKMKTKTEIHYADNANYKYGSAAPLEATKHSVYQTDYEYDDKAQLIKETTKNSNNTLHIKKIVYPYSKLEDPVHKEMERRHIINAPIQETYYLGSKLLRGSKFNYNLFNDNKHILLESIESISPENKLTQENAYTYNSIGKPIQVETKSGLTNSFLWDFNGRLLRLKIENINIKDLQPLISQDIINSSRIAQINWMEYKQKIDSKFGKSFTDLFEYDEKGLLIYRHEFSSRGTSYSYDPVQRLKNIKDNSYNLLTQYDYIYREKVEKVTFLNRELLKKVMRRCPKGMIADEMKWIVPGGMILSPNLNLSDKKAYDLYYPLALKEAEEKYKCYRYGTYAYSIPNDPYNNIPFKVYTFSAYFKRDRLYINKLVLESKVLSYPFDNLWTPVSGVVVAELSDAEGHYAIKDISPDNAKPITFTSANREWELWVSSDGKVLIRLHYMYANDTPPYNQRTMIELPEEVSFPIKPL